MKNKSIIIIILLVFLQLIVFAQETDKTVSITVSGSGKTQEQAKQAALRSAIEQAFGTFISSKTEIFNDQVVADEIASVANGNIQSFTILNESQLPDSSWGVTLKAIVSVNKLTSFVQAKGIQIEIKGGLLALNIKQQYLNEKSEIDIIANLVGFLHEIMQTSFDFYIQNAEPQSVDNYNKNWLIPINIYVKTNKNYDFCAEYCLSTITALGLTTQEIENYKTLNKKIYPITFINTNGNKTIYLRAAPSISMLSLLISQLDFYSKTFIISNGINKLYGHKIDLLSKNINPTTINNNNDIVFNFLKSNSEYTNYIYNDKITLNQLEQINSYTIEPSGVVSKYKNGGFVVYEKNGHGLVAGIIDYGIVMNWENANMVCQRLELNKYDDWRLPNKYELNEIYNNLGKYNLGGFVNDFYWSSDIQYNTDVFIRHINRKSDLLTTHKDNWGNVRAVRSF